MTNIVIALCAYGIGMALWHIAECIEELSREIRQLAQKGGSNEL